MTDEEVKRANFIRTLEETMDIAEACGQWAACGFRRTLLSACRTPLRQRSGTASTLNSILASRVRKADATLNQPPHHLGSATKGEKAMRLTKKEFRAWLEANSQRLVGTPAHGSFCPIAEFLHDKGNPEAVVGYISYDLNDHDSNRRLPEWAMEFISQIDERRAKVRGATALKILDSI